MVMHTPVTSKGMYAIIVRSYFLSHLVMQSMNSDQDKHGTRENSFNRKD